VWCVIAATAIGAAATLGAVWWVWAGGLLWLALSLMALLSQTDPASRAYIAGTLGKASFVQVYTTLTRRTLTQTWSRFCDPVADSAPASHLFRAALTWRLYDRAMLIAVACPLLLPVVWWVVTGRDAGLGDVVVIPGTAFRDVWPERAITILSLAGLVGGLLLTILMARRGRGIVFVIAPLAAWLITLATLIATALVFALPIVIFGQIILGMSVLLALTVNGAAQTADETNRTRQYRCFGSFILALAAVTASSPIVAKAYGLGPASTWLLELMPVIFAGFIWFLIERRGHHQHVNIAVSLILPAAWALATMSFPWTEVSDAQRVAFICLAVLPLINAIFHVLSYAVTLTLIRLGLRAKLPFLYGLYDLAFALILFAALGATLTATLAALNVLSGTTLIDLSVLFAGIKSDPSQYWWLYSMVFLTILPTAAHFLISLLGLQGLTPKPIRRTVAGWITKAGQSHLFATAAPFALGTIWTAPLWALGGFVWVFWSTAGEAITAFGVAYLILLSALAGTIGG